jgi:hypothetical protein
MLVRRTAIAAAIVAAPLAFAAPAWADTTDVSCSPCTWEDSMANNPWETVWPNDPKKPGPWEKAFANGPWESATANGTWEKTFENAPMP